MATRTAAVLKRVVQKVAVANSTDLSDRELLRRFGQHNDEAAFATLVSRHSGMVFGVCRRSLPTVQDAEDACQAVFVILARKAKSEPWQTSVANWLYATARRVARNARVSAARRAKREGKAGAMKANEPLDRMSGRDLLAMLDDELDQLAPHYREALVLFYLHGLTQQEAAARLGVPLTTLKMRLERGRKKLGEALQKRGSEFGVGLLALAATSAAGASPPHLDQTVLAAVSGSPRPAVAALAKGVAVNGILTRMTLAAVAAVGVVVVGLGFASRSPIAAEPQKPAPVDSKNDKPQSNVREQIIAGRVVTADGKPVVAELSANWIEGKLESLGRTKADGSFQVTVPFKEQGGWLAATADGYGMEFVSLRTEVRSPVTLALPVAQPIRGRAIDPQGKPLAGLRVTVDSVTCYDGNSLEKHLKRWTEEFYAHGIPPDGDRSMWYRSNNLGRRQSESPIFATTDADGKFTVNGVGAGQLFGLKIHGAGVADTSVTVMNRRDFNPKPYLDAADAAAKLIPGRRARYSQLYGPEPLVIVEREKLIRGTVTARDTGKPLAGVMVTTVVHYGENLGYSSISESVTDRDGRYELHGVRKSNRYSVERRTDPNMGYFASTAEGDDTAGYEPIVVNLECVKGVIVTGTVKDKATGKPLAATVSRVEVPGNPFAKNYPANNLRGAVISSADGRFQFVTIPGPIVVTALVDKAKDGQIYRPVKPDPNYPTLFRNQAVQWCRVIETKETDRAVTVEIELEPAPRMTVKVVDADGAPLTGTHATGITQTEYSRPVPYLNTDTLTVYNVEPKQERLLAVVHAKRKLLGTAVVREADKDPVVKLGPGGSVTGRVVDADGKPIAGMKVKLYFTRHELCEASDLLNGETEMRETVGRRETLTDASGEFRIDALFPGYEFRLIFTKGRKPFGPDYGKAVRHTIAKHGDTLKLADLRLEPNEHNPE